MSQRVETCKGAETEHRQAGVDLERVTLQQLVAADLSSHALRGWELENLMDAAVRLTADALGVEFCNIFKLEKSSEELRLVAGVGWLPGLVGAVTVSTDVESLAGYTLHSEAPVLIEDFGSDGRFNDPFLEKDHGVVSGISVAMIAGRFVFGVMGAHSSRRWDFSESDIHFLETIANIITISVLRGQAVEALSQVNKGLLVTKRHIESIIEVSPNAIISTNAEGDVVLCNQVAEDLLGYKREEIVGQHVSTLFESEEQASEIMRLMREQGDTLSGFETTLRAKDGNLIPVAASASIFHDEEGQEAGTVAVFIDLRERKRWEEQLNEVKNELMETSNHLNRLMDIAPDVIMSTNSEGFVVVCNPQAKTLLGYKQEEIVGQHISMLYESEERAAEIVRQLHENGNTLSGFETKLRAKDGSLVPFVVSLSFIPCEEGHEAGIIWCKKDIRERKRLEEELGKANESLYKANNTIEQAQASAMAAEKLAALGRLTAGVAHEILNPLNIVTLRLHMMIRNPDIPPEIIRHLKILDEQASRIAKITEDLLYFARQREPERMQLNLNEAVQRTLGLLEYDLRKNNVDVVLGLADKLPAIPADPDQLQQVILNLLTNARDAMPDGGRLDLTTGTVQTNGRPFVELRVADSGGGIAQENLDKLFEPFFTTKPEGKGTGLGLSICRGIVESHGGSIWAESEEGHGATFVIQLPQQQDDEGSS